MSNIGTPEQVTQNRVIKLFRNELDYDYLGDWQDRDGNSNIEEGQLSAYLKQSRVICPAPPNGSFQDLRSCFS